MPDKKKRTTALMGLGLCFLVAAGASDAIPLEELRASHQKMLQLLKDIAERSAAEHPYLGEARARCFRAQLEVLPADAPASQRSSLRFQLGMAELYLGNERQAIDHLTRAYDLFRGAQKSASRAAGELEFRLGLAYLRLGETQNCCLRFTPDSGILPIRDGGIHKVEEGSRKAIQYYNQGDGSFADVAARAGVRNYRRDEHLTNEKVEKFYHEYPKSFEAPKELWIQEILVSDLDESMPEKRHALHPTQSP